MLPLTRKGEGLILCVWCCAVYRPAQNEGKKWPCGCGIRLHKYTIVRISAVNCPMYRISNHRTFRCIAYKNRHRWCSRQKCLVYRNVWVWVWIRNFTAAASGVVKDYFVTNALRELTIGFCRGNGTLYRRGLGVMSCASGIAFQAGMIVPTSEVP